jgi:hypothetical protein
MKTQDLLEIGKLASFFGLCFGFAQAKVMTKVPRTNPDFAVTGQVSIVSAEQERI